MRIFLALVLACVFTAAVSGCGKNKSDSGSTQTRKIGGCEIETVTIGTGTGSAEEAPTEAAWIRASSVEFAGNDLYKKAAEDLRTALSARGVRIHSCTELMHVKEGSCWPPYSVEFRIALTEVASMRLRLFLQQNALAHCPPHAERPEGYGTFFVSCGTGDSDWWTVWYEK